MSDTKLKVFFLASGKIAVPTLEALAKSDKINLIGVGTQPDKKAGRGNRLTPTPIGRTAEELSLAPMKVQNINAPETIENIKQLDPDFVLVIAFGQLLKEEILNLPKIDCINIHASILPFYRGASPIASVILNGEKETGISIMKMEKGLDSGPVYETLTIPIAKEDNSQTLEEKLARLSAENTINSLLKIAAGMKNTPQDHSISTHCRKIMKTDAELDWNDSASILRNKIHAYFPWPGAYFFLDSGKGLKRITLISAEICSEVTDELPGTIIDGGKSRWLIACGKKEILEIFTVKPEGKKVMNAADFLRGSRLEAGNNLNIKLNSLTK